MGLLQQQGYTSITGKGSTSTGGGGLLQQQGYTSTGQQVNKTSPTTPQKKVALQAPSKIALQAPKKIGGLTINLTSPSTTAQNTQVLQALAQPLQLKSGQNKLTKKQLGEVTGTQRVKPLEPKGIVDSLTSYFKELGGAVKEEGAANVVSGLKRVVPTSKTGAGAMLRTSQDLLRDMTPQEASNPLTGPVSYFVRKLIEKATKGKAATIGSMLPEGNDLALIAGQKLIESGRAGSERENKAYAELGLPEINEQAPIQEKIKNPRWLLRSLSLNVPSFLTSLGIGLATGAATKNPVIPFLAMFSTSAVQNAGDTYNEAKEFGATDEVAEKTATIVGAVNGILDSLGLDEIIDVSTKPLRGIIVKEILKRVAVSAGSEGATESLQQIVQNIVAQKFYDAGRDIFANVAESGLIGAIWGGGAGGGITAAQLTLSDGKTLDVEAGEKTPQEVAGLVVGNGLEGTPEGKEIMKVVVQAQDEGKNIVIESEKETLAPAESKQEGAQLMDKAADEVAPKTTTKVDTDPVEALKAEARKYKSAEEFVKAQPKLYRGEGGTNQFSGKTAFIEGRNYAKDSSRAETFGKVGEYSLDPNARVLKINTVGKELDTIAKELGVSENSILSPSRLRQELSAKGYDAVEYTTRLGKNGKLDPDGKIVTDVIVLNDDAIKTKSQLTDIYNQATKEPPMAEASSQTLPKDVSISEEAKTKVTKVLKLMGNDLQDINIVGSTARGKVNPNDLDILITPKNKLPEMKSIPGTSQESLYRRQELAKVFKDELQPLFPNKTLHVTIAEYDAARGPKVPIDSLISGAKKWKTPKPIDRTQETRPAETKVVEKPVKEVEVPRAQIPQGEGKTKVSRLEARVRGFLDETGKRINQDTDPQLYATYQEVNREENKSKAIDFVEKVGAEEAIAVLQGKKEAPPGVLNNSIYLALQELARDDSGLGLRLASVASTRAGQEISMLAEIDKENPVSIAQEIFKIAEEKFERRFRGKKKKDVVEGYNEKGRLIIDESSPKLTDWGELLNLLEC